MTHTPIILSWSGGKDCTLALAALQADPAYHVVGLLATFTEGYDRISMHGVRRSLIAAQARALGVPLHEVWIPQNCTDEVYRSRMAEATERIKAGGVKAVAFGDLFLEDVREYREQNLESVGMEAVFPLWGRDTGDLARFFIEQGYKARVVCLNPEQLDPSFTGRLLDESFLADLPDGVDPCGENGEFHTFVFEGPIFSKPVTCRMGEVVMRDGFCFTDIVPT